MKPEFMLASLVWWGTNVCLLFACVYSYFLSLHGELHEPTKSEVYFSAAIGNAIVTQPIGNCMNSNNHCFSFTVYWTCTFFVAIICYLSAKEYLQKSPVNV